MSEALPHSAFSRVPRLPKILSLQNQLLKPLGKEEERIKQAMIMIRKKPSVAGKAQELGCPDRSNCKVRAIEAPGGGISHGVWGGHPRHRGGCAWRELRTTGIACTPEWGVGGAESKETCAGKEIRESLPAFLLLFLLQERKQKRRGGGK